MGMTKLKYDYGKCNLAAALRLMFLKYRPIGP